MDSMIEIAIFTVIGLVILFAISFATFYILKRKDNISDFFKSLGKDVESIDFSGFKVEGYEYYKSTYARRGNKSALITPEYSGLISNFIPTYYDNEKWLLRILRLFIDHRKRSKDLDDSLLYYLYCNGFRTGYNEIEYEIASKDLDSIDKCNKYISKYKRKIYASDLSQVPTQDWTYFKLLGKHEGAIVRGLLYEEEERVVLNSNFTEIKISKKPGRKPDDRTFQEMLSQSVEDINLILTKVEQRLTTNNTDLEIAYLKIALEEMSIMDKCDVAPFRNALAVHYKNTSIVEERGIQRVYYKLTTSKNGAKLCMNFGKDRERIDELKQFLLH